MNRREWNEEEPDERERALPVWWWIGAAAYAGALCVIAFFIGRAFG